MANHAANKRPRAITIATLRESNNEFSQDLISYAHTANPVVLGRSSLHSGIGYLGIVA
jgi:hypothetical protein